MFIKLVKRHIPVPLLELLENLFSGCYSYAQWYNVWSLAFEINFGVRQRSVLSPFSVCLIMTKVNWVLHLKVVV